MGVLLQFVGLRKKDIDTIMMLIMCRRFTILHRGNINGLR